MPDNGCHCGQIPCYNMYHYLYHRFDSGCFVLWGLSRSMVMLYIFSMVYGLFAGSFTSTWPGIMREVKKRKVSADAGMIFAWLAAGRGIGSVVSGPLSETLLNGEPWLGRAGFAYGSGYGD